MQQHGRILWTELNTKHPEEAKAFYGTAFGWTFDGMPMENGTYWLARVTGVEQPIAGIFTMHGPYFDNMSDHWLTYFGVSDIDASIAELPKLGGKLLRDIFHVPGVGRIAIVRGATGAGEGWMQPEMPTGG